MRYLATGVAFGFVLTRAEVISWFRIQEMFRFQAFHMYGIIASAIVVAAIGLELMRRRSVLSLDGTPVSLEAKAVGRGTRYLAGGTIFGIGWALTGACPGPLFGLVGAGLTVMIVPIGAALLGTWMYGWLRPRLPH